MKTINMTNSMLVLLVQTTMFVYSVIGIHWDHSANLNDDYRVLWTVSKPQKQLQHQQLLASFHPSNYEITFEIQVRTLGYIGFGFSPDGNRGGADIVIGWVDQGQTYFQVSLKLISFYSCKLCHSLDRKSIKLFSLRLCVYIPLIMVWKRQIAVEWKMRGENA